MSKHPRFVKIKSKFLTVIAVMALSIPAFAADPPSSKLPTVKTNTDKLKYLTAVKEYIPNIFDNASQYETDLFHLLERQEHLVQQLESQSKYRKTAGQYPRIELRLEPNESRVIDQNALQDWKQSQMKLLDELKDFEVNTALDQRLKNSIARMGTGSAQGFTTGLIQVLPKEQRGALFSLPPEQQWKALQKQLPDDLTGSSFKGEFYALSPSDLKKTNLLEVLKTKVNAEAEFNRLMQLKLVLDEDAGQGAKNFDSAKKTIENTGEEKLARITQRKFIEKQIAAMGEGVPSDLGRIVSGKIEQQMRGMYQHASANSVLTKPMTLTEVPPEIGIFRGYMGGDCATQNSFGYVWGPEDRTFMIRSADGELKGYASMTYVKQGRGEKSLYLHSINGPKLSKQDAQAVIQGVYQARSELGVKSVILPSKTLYDLNNFEQVRRGFQEMSNAGKAVSIDYLDQYSRDEISKVSEGKYELAEANTEGVLMREPENVRPLKFSVNESKVKLVPRNISRLDGLMLALEYSKKSQPKAIEPLLEAVGINRASFDEYMKAINNPEKKPIQEFLKSIEKKFAKIDPSITREFLMKKTEMLASGILRATDAIQGENLKLSKSIVFEQLENRHSVVEMYDFLEEHPVHFRKDPKLVSSLRKTMLDERTPIDKFKRVQRALQSEQIGEALVNWSKEMDHDVLRGNSFFMMNELKPLGYEKHLLRGLEDPVEKVSLVASKMMSAHLAQTPSGSMAQKVADLMVKNQNNRRGFVNAQILLLSNAKDRAGVAFTRNPTVHELVFRELVSENPMGKVAASISFRSLDLSQNPKKFEYLKELIAGDDQKTREMAAKMAFEDPKGLKKSKLDRFFKDLYRDPNTIIYEMAVRNMSEADLLETFQRERSEKLLQRLALKAADFNTPAMEKILNYALESDEFNVLNSALMAYQNRELKPDAFAKIEGILLKRENENLARSASAVLFKHSSEASDRLLLDLISGKIESKALPAHKIISNLSRPLANEASERAMLAAILKSGDPLVRGKAIEYLIRNAVSSAIADDALKIAFDRAPDSVLEITLAWAKRNPDQFPQFVKSKMLEAIRQGQVKASALSSMMNNSMIRDPDLLGAIESIIGKGKTKESFEWNLFQGTIDNAHFDDRYVRLMKRVYDHRELGLQKIMNDKIKSAHGTKLGREVMNSISADISCDGVMKTVFQNKKPKL